MANQELLNYVQEALNADKNINEIQLELVTNGWQAADIQEVLKQIDNQAPFQRSNQLQGKFSQKILGFIFGKAKIIFAALIILILLTWVVFVLNSKNKSNNESKLNSTGTTVKTNYSNQSGFGNLIKSEKEQNILADNQSGYRIFEKIGAKNESKLTLIDPSGKVVNTTDIPNPVKLVASLKSMWLLKNDKYWLLDSRGSINSVSEDVGEALLSGTGINSENSQTKQFYTISDNEVLYQTNYNSSTNIQRKVYRINLKTGEKKEVSLGKYPGGLLAQVSLDYNTIYLIGYDIKLIKDPPQKPEDIESILHIIAIDLRSGKIQDSIPKNIYLNTKSKLWISPNGKYIAYTKDGGSTVQIYNIITDTNNEVKLPERWITNSLGGDVLPIPVWSSDSMKFLFGSYIFPAQSNDTNKKIISYIDINNFSNNTILSMDSKDYLNTDKNESGTDSYYFENLGWFNNNVAQFSFGKHEKAGDNQVKNYEYHIDTKKLQKLPSEYGELLGNYYF